MENTKTLEFRLQILDVRFPEFGSRIRERRRNLGYQISMIARALTSLTAYKASTLELAISNIEKGKLLGMMSYAPGYSGSLSSRTGTNTKVKMLHRLSSYLTILRFNEDDEIIQTLKNYYQPRFVPPFEESCVVCDVRKEMHPTTPHFIYPIPNIKPSILINKTRLSPAD